MLLGFPLRPNMDTTFYAPERSIDMPFVQGGFVPGEPPIVIPDEAAHDLIAYQRGQMAITWSRGDQTNDFDDPDPAGNTWVMQMGRPMKAFGPSMMFIEVHTTGVKCRTLSHDNEKACWSLSVNSAGWLSAKSNNGCRRCAQEDGANSQIGEFYPEGLNYRGTQQWRPNPIV